MAADRSPQVGALIPVRLASERLPGKALLEIEGRPVLAHLLDRVFASREIRRDQVVVCTTPEPEDDALVRAVEKLGARVFRGDRDDLIDRLSRARDAFGMDVVVQVDGDDPCIDTGYVDRLVMALRADPAASVAVTDGLPLGIGCKAMTAGAFATVRAAYRTLRNDTGFSNYFTKSGLCRVAVVTADAADRDTEARLTLDYPEDLEFFRRLFAELYRPSEVFGVRQIVDLLRRRPELRALNGGRNAEFWQRTAERARLEFDGPGGARRQVTS